MPAVSEGQAPAPAPAEDAGHIQLQLKPFGKHGVRLFWQRADVVGVLHAEYLSEPTWMLYGALADGADGVEVVRELPEHPDLLPRSVVWRLSSKLGCSTSSIECLSSRTGPPQLAPPPCIVLKEVEMAWNVLQWGSTMVVDCRDGSGVLRLPGSLICPSVGSIPGLGFKDDALCIECPAEVLSLVHKRLFRSLYLLPLAVLEQLVSMHAYLFSDIHLRDPAVRNWPNLIGGSVLLGHQGHARSLDDYVTQLGVAGVVNMAGNKVASSANALPENLQQNYVDLRHADGEPLTDGVGDQQRFTEVLVDTLNVVDRVSEAGRVLVHCQMGRSRSAAVVVGWLLRREPTWDLFRAVEFVGGRRPEVQINVEYLAALEQWAIGDMGRQSSLDRVKDELPHHVRGASESSLPTN